MTIRKILLIVLVLMSVIAVGVNAIILTSLTDRYFQDYLTENYQRHMNQIKDYMGKVLEAGDVSYQQMTMELETHLQEPIVRIRLYNPLGHLLVDVEQQATSHSGHMRSKMMGMSPKQIKKYEITRGEEIVGILNVTTQGLAENSFVATRFKAALIFNSLYAIMVSVAIALIMGVIISKRMSKSLKDTAIIANDIQTGEVKEPSKTSIKEIIDIRSRLMELHGRLKLKQRSRKVLMDQIIHQTRTPLTILKSHIEAMEDGIMDLNKDEYELCHNQIDSITAIISNLAGMIDAEKETEKVQVDDFELSRVLRQIKMGLNTQFNKKSIEFHLKSCEKVNMRTDKSKLSQSIYNILTNAYKYTESGGTVSIVYKVVGERIHIRVQDTGRGIKAQDVSKIFDAYVRGSDVIDTEGDGIGLYIVKENVASLNGIVSVESRVGVGSTFTIEIPKNLKNDKVFL